jgi:hypothetical protein
MSVASDISQDTRRYRRLVTVEERAILFVSATVSVLRLYSGTHHRHMLDTLLISGSPDFPKFHTKSNAVQRVRILNIPPASYPKRRRHPSTLTKTISLATHGNHKTEFRQRMVLYNEIVKGVRHNGTYLRAHLF